MPPMNPYCRQILKKLMGCKIKGSGCALDGWVCWKEICKWPIESLKQPCPPKPVVGRSGFPCGHRHGLPEHNSCKVIGTQLSKARLRAFVGLNLRVSSLCCHCLNGLPKKFNSGEASNHESLGINLPAGAVYKVTRPWKYLLA